MYNNLFKTENLMLSDGAHDHPAVVTRIGAGGFKEGGAAAQLDGYAFCDFVGLSRKDVDHLAASRPVERAVDYGGGNENDDYGIKGAVDAFVNNRRPRKNDGVKSENYVPQRNMGKGVLYKLCENVGAARGSPADENQRHARSRQHSAVYGSKHWVAAVFGHKGGKHVYNRRGNECGGDGF